MIATRGKVAGFLSAVVVVALAGALSVVLTGRSAMALFGTNVLFSEVEGQIVQDGKPVKDAEVTQITLWSSQGEVSPVTTSSDENGRFRFAEITRKGGFSNLLPGQITIVQKINIKHGGKEYRGWINTKSNFERHGESNGKPLKFICNLNHTPSNQGNDFGVCKLI